MLAELFKHSAYVDKSYDSAQAKYVFKISDRPENFDVHIMPPEILTAALIAHRMEKK
jgi:hypothetical protein